MMSYGSARKAAVSQVFQPQWSIPFVQPLLYLLCGIIRQTKDSALVECKVNSDPIECLYFQCWRNTQFLSPHNGKIPGDRMLSIWYHPAPVSCYITGCSNNSTFFFFFEISFPLHWHTASANLFSHQNGGNGRAHVSSEPNHGKVLLQAWFLKTLLAQEAQVSPVRRLQICFNLW